MSRLKIHFFSEDISFILKQKTLIRTWIRKTILDEGYKLNELNFIFCNDNYLLNINQNYLKHNTYTDIITFDNSDVKGEIAGDIYISIDRVRENASIFGVNEENELHRVMIHGTLHLLGYLDKKKEEKGFMTEKEDYYLSKRPFKV